MKEQRWSVLADDPADPRRVIARCACGTEKSVGRYQIKTGRSTSCGCRQRELAAARATTHGMTNSPEFTSWLCMKARCTNPRNDNFARYGGRGIQVHAGWMESFEDFYAHLGPKPSPSHTLDRIDVDGDYEPGNVRWATPSEQRANQAPQVLSTHCGRGHLFDEANTILESTGHRHCRACRRLADRARRDAANGDPR